LEVRRTAAPAVAAFPAAILAGTAFGVLDGPPALAEAVAALLSEHGASVQTSTGGDQLDGVVHLGGLRRGEDPLLPEAFADFQAILRRQPRWLLAAYPRAASAGGGLGAAGLAGLVRTIDREYPQTVTRAVEVDPAAPRDQIARLLVAELLTDDRLPVVVRTGAERWRYEPVEVGLGSLGSTGAGPAGDGTAEAQAIGLDRDSVVVVFGGARGITAQVAGALATASRCRLELVGRTQPAVEPESPAVAAAPDRVALRAALVRQGMRSPAEIERTVTRILAEREVANTLTELREQGSRVRYHALDVRDTEAVHRLLKEIHTEHGRLDGVVYAAGVIEDRLLAEKDLDSFRRVFATKVDGARAVLAAMEEMSVRPRFTVLFGSIAAVLGNRGQADYAAANDAMESIGRDWAVRTGLRCLTVHWGPWAPSTRHGGMVTPELHQEYARRGISLIDPEEGALSLLRELAWGAEDATAVVYTASAW
jgi:NAD(P)-dependent dehydrogenase (short-subunit alcohol dehydrogenase family)